MLPKVCAWITVVTFTKICWILPMHSNVTIKNVSWPHFSWPTLYMYVSVCVCVCVAVIGELRDTWPWCVFKKETLTFETMNSVEACQSMVWCWSLYSYYVAMLLNSLDFMSAFLLFNCTLCMTVKWVQVYGLSTDNSNVSVNVNLRFI